MTRNGARSAAATPTSADALLAVTGPDPTNDDVDDDDPANTSADALAALALDETPGDIVVTPADVAMTDDEDLAEGTVETRPPVVQGGAGRQDAQIAAAVEAAIVRLSQQHAEERARAAAEHQRVMSSMLDMFADKLARVSNGQHTTAGSHGNARAAAQRALVEDARQGVPDFHGERDANKVEAFLRAFNKYCEVSHLDGRARVQAFGYKLFGRAATWWVDVDCHWQQYAGEDGANFGGIADAFRREFYPPNWRREQYARWHDLSVERSGSLLKFLRDFKTNLDQLTVVFPDVTELERWMTLTCRLPQAELDFLDLRGIKTTAEAITVLIARSASNAADARKRASTGPAIRVNALQPSAQSTKRRKANPEVAALRAKFDHVVVNDSNYNDFEKLPVLTDRLREFLAKRKGCFYCRKLEVPIEHTAVWCARHNRDHRRPPPKGNKKDF
jgi:hypothetical protein